MKNNLFTYFIFFIYLIYFLNNYLKDIIFKLLKISLIIVKFIIIFN